jgi:hypothetical protein
LAALAAALEQTPSNRKVCVCVCVCRQFTLPALFTRAPLLLAAAHAHSCCRMPKAFRDCSPSSSMHAPRPRSGTCVCGRVEPVFWFFFFAAELRACSRLSTFHHVPAPLPSLKPLQSSAAACIASLAKSEFARPAVKQALPALAAAAAAEDVPLARESVRALAVLARDNDSRLQVCESL